MIHLPLLRADGLGYDFPGVLYDNSIERLSDDEVRVQNVLSGPDADTFAKCVLSGSGAWTSEVRSPQALFSESVVHRHGGEGVEYRERGEGRVWEYIVGWDASMCAARTFIVTQLVTVERMFLPRNILSTVWAGGAETLTYPEGRVAARGNVFAVEDAVFSILEFVVKSEMRDGEMQVSEPDDQKHFKVFMNERTLSLAQSSERRDILTAALVGAMSRLDPSHSPDESQVLGEMAARLRERVVTDWTEEEDYDPVAAATCLEPFVFPTEGEVE